MKFILAFIIYRICASVDSDTVKEAVAGGQKAEAEESGDAMSTQNLATVKQDDPEAAEAWQEVKRKPRPAVGKTKNRSSLSESSHGVAAEELEFQFDEDLDLPARQRNYSSSRYSL